MTRPGRAVKETSSTAVTPAYVLVSDSTVIMGSTLTVWCSGHGGLLGRSAPGAQDQSPTVAARGVVGHRP
ncbi:hypothetical protein GCM10009719_10270 [Nocardioides kribbensis]